MRYLFPKLRQTIGYRYVYNCQIKTEIYFGIGFDVLVERLETDIAFHIF